MRNMRVEPGRHANFVQPRVAHVHSAAASSRWQAVVAAAWARNAAGCPVLDRFPRILVCHANTQRPPLSVETPQVLLIRLVPNEFLDVPEHQVAQFTHRCTTLTAVFSATAQFSGVLQPGDKDILQIAIS